MTDESDEAPSLTRMLGKSPEERYPDYECLLADLRRARRGEPFELESPKELTPAQP